MCSDLITITATISQSDASNLPNYPIKWVKSGPLYIIQSPSKSVFLMSGLVESMQITMPNKTVFLVQNQPVNNGPIT
jgi:hypothetical protein